MDAESLRQEFERSFAAAPRPLEALETYLVLRVGREGQSYAVATSELTGLSSRKTFTELPGAPPEMLGLATFRGTIVPVYSLALLLGLPPGESGCLALLDTSLAFAFEAVHGQLRVQSAQVHGDPGSDEQVLSLGERSLPIVRLSSLRARVEQLIGARKESHE